MQHTSWRQLEAVNSLENPEPHGVSLHLRTRHRPRPDQPHLGTAPAPFRMPRASHPAPLGSLGKRPPSLFPGSWSSRAVLLVSSPGKVAWLFACFGAMGCIPLRPVSLPGMPPALAVSGASVEKLSFSRSPQPAPAIGGASCFVLSCVVVLCVPRAPSWNFNLEIKPPIPHFPSVF